MSSRRLRREAEALRELQLAGIDASVDELAQSSASGSEDGASVYAGLAKQKGLGFAALAQPDLAADDEEDEEESAVEQKKSAAKKKKKKKKTVATAAPARESLEFTAQKSANQNQPSSGKKKKKGKVVQSEGDEVDKALSELSLKYPDLEQVTKTGSSSQQAFSIDQNALLSVSLANLDSEAEMRKFFGAKVISASRAQEKQPRGARKVVQSLKSNLTKPQPTWWSASQREGLSIRMLKGEECTQKANRCHVPLTTKDDRWWTIEYSKRYRSVTKAFWEAVQSGDPERFYKILTKLPWHADTLLQLSEVNRHREEYSTAVDLLNRALFTYERSFIGAFAFTAGGNRLDFDYVENRPFYLALSRMVSDLQRRGCNRTSFEFARLLLSLDPYSDPHGALMFLDFLAIRSGMHDWLLSVWDLHASERGRNELKNCFNVTDLPGWSFARSLALRSKEDAMKEKTHQQSTSALEQAIKKFPFVLPILADKIDLFLPSEIRGHPDFRIHVDASSLPSEMVVLHLLAHLYVHRSSALWKLPENSEWLKNATLSVFRTYGSARKPSGGSNIFNPNLSRSVYRHIVTLTDANAVRKLTAFFPREILLAPSLSCDPLPPLTAVSQYDGDFFRGCEDIFAFRPRTQREREMDARNLARMIPDAAVRQQLQVLYDARPDLQQQFPEGVVQFAQVAAQMGEDFWDNFLPQPQDVARVQGRQLNGPHLNLADFPPGWVPGGFDDEIGEADFDDESEVEEEEGNNLPERDQEEANLGDNPVPTFPARIWQNLVGRFWGGTEHGPANGEAQ